MADTTPQAPVPTVGLLFVILTLAVCPSAAADLWGTDLHTPPSSPVGAGVICATWLTMPDPPQESACWAHALDGSGLWAGASCDVDYAHATATCSAALLA